MKLAPDTGIVLMGAGDPRGMTDAEAWIAGRVAFEESLAAPWWRRPLLRARIQRRVASQLPLVEPLLRSITVDSPFLRVSSGLADLVAERLGGSGYVALLDAEPRAATTLDLMMAEGMRRAILVPASPCADSESAAVAAAFRSAWATAGRDPGDLLAIGGWDGSTGHALARTALVQETLAGMRGGSRHLLFLAPGRTAALAALHPRLPARIEANRREICERLAIPDPDASIAYLRAATGPSVDRPRAEDELARLAAAGVSRLVLVPIGWATDCFETLGLIDLEFARLARAHRMTLFRVPTLNDRPEAVAAFVALVGAAARERGWTA